MKKFLILTILLAATAILFAGCAPRRLATWELRNQRLSLNNQILQQAIEKEGQKQLHRAVGDFARAAKIGDHLRAQRLLDSNPHVRRYFGTAPGEKLELQTTGRGGVRVIKFGANGGTEIVGVFTADQLQALY